MSFSHTTGGAAYLLYMSRTLAGSCACVTSLLWLVALRYGAFQRKSQRLFQDALADTGQVAEEVRSSIRMECLLRCAVRSCTTPYQAANRTSTTASSRHLPVQYRGNARIPSAAQKALAEASTQVLLQVAYRLEFAFHVYSGLRRCRCSRCRGWCARLARRSGRGRATAAG